HEQVAFLFAGVRLREQPADERQLAEDRDTRAVLDDLGLRETTDHGRLAVGDEELVVGAALVEEEAEVTADDVQPRLLGVNGHADLAVARDVRGNAENDAALLELHVRAGGDADLAGASRVDHADRRFLTDENLGDA